ncbi:hypothetical protein SARC_03191 [Sphaeroforma arctica JP610]|uniref:C2H2-type domain-containing protein n=1 Tax=Sphaeroforma arctica JP610 TaxID=667725 RepID=A0A0L0G6P9_9EUKA|nr:hypothetical protein SARC_03191 [Sphaeroforma arctica JP610]KNC84594.1 hypothetical protein SARC_03191 [Sphaeroforma arctica JP610]|eukprot:XP_014158496.1 hypothetical protein SARC_03191 [Sphaeroforma arctica JP610]
MHESKLEDKPYRCEYTGCRAAFIHHSALKTHSYTHSGERPYRCEYRGCDASFAHPSNLATHKRIHTGEKPYVCKEEGCTAAFAQSSNLTRHIRSHTKQKPYVCEVCKARYSSVRSRSRHMLTHDAVAHSSSTVRARAATATGRKRLSDAGVVFSAGESENVKTDEDESKDDDGAYTRVDECAAVVPSLLSKRKRYSISHPYAGAHPRVDRVDSCTHMYGQALTRSAMYVDASLSSRRAHLLYDDENVDGLDTEMEGSNFYSEARSYIHTSDVDAVEVEKGHVESIGHSTGLDKGALRMSSDNPSAVVDSDEGGTHYANTPAKYKTEATRMSVDSMLMPSSRQWSDIPEQHSIPEQPHSELHRYVPPACRELNDADTRADHFDSKPSLIRYDGLGTSLIHTPTQRQRQRRSTISSSNDYTGDSARPDGSNLRMPANINSNYNQYNQTLTQAQIHAQAKADARARGSQHASVQSACVPDRVSDVIVSSSYPAIDDIKWARSRRASKKHRDSGVDLDEDMEMAHEICVRYEFQQQRQQRMSMDNESDVRTTVGRNITKSVSAQENARRGTKTSRREKSSYTSPHLTDQWEDCLEHTKQNVTIQSPVQYRTSVQTSHSPYRTDSEVPRFNNKNDQGLCREESRATVTSQAQDHDAPEGNRLPSDSEAPPQHRSSLNMLVEVLQNLVKS